MNAECFLANAMPPFLTQLYDAFRWSVQREIVEICTISRLTAQRNASYNFLKNGDMAFAKSIQQLRKDKHCMHLNTMQMSSKEKMAFVPAQKRFCANSCSYFYLTVNSCRGRIAAMCENATCDSQVYTNSLCRHIDALCEDDAS